MVVDLVGGADLLQQADPELVAEAESRGELLDPEVELEELVRLDLLTSKPTRPTRVRSCPGPTKR